MWTSDRNETRGASEAGTHTSWLLVVRSWGQRKLCGLLPFGHCDRPGNPRHRGTLSDRSCFLLRDMFDLGAEARRRRKWWSAIPTFSRFIWCHLSQGSPPPCGPPGTATWFAGQLHSSISVAYTRKTGRPGTIMRPSRLSSTECGTAFSRARNSRDWAIVNPQPALDPPDLHGMRTAGRPPESFEERERRGQQHRFGRRSTACLQLLVAILQCWIT